MSHVNFNKWPCPLSGDDSCTPRVWGPTVSGGGGGGGGAGAGAGGGVVLRGGGGGMGG